MEQPVLSICMPIYNRKLFLERQLKRFFEDKALFNEKVQLIISDNCSEDDLQSTCIKFQEQGLKIAYYRQDSNIGPDRNFEWCFYHADGKYVWLLGSDDVPVTGFLRTLLAHLEDSDYGLVHLSMHKMNQEFTIYHTSDDMAVAVNYWFTFMSANIIRSASLRHIDLSDYRESFMIQVPAYLNACCSYNNNAIIYIPQFFEKDTDAANNGGYNLFRVFVKNLFGIYESFVEKGLLSRQAFEMMIKIEYREFLIQYIIKLLILPKHHNYAIEGSWKLLIKYYSMKPYAYYYLLLEFLKIILRPIKSFVIHSK